MHRKLSQTLFVVPLTCLLLAAAAGQTQPASRPAAPALDLSTPRSALVSLCASLKSGDIAAARNCLSFSSEDQAQSFDISYTQLYAPLALVHAVQARFGPEGGKPFGVAPLEKSLDDLLARAQAADIQITGDTAAVVDHSDINPSAETELTGITFKKQAGANGAWKVTASTFMTAAGQTPAAQKKFMLALRDATAVAVRATSARLANGEFKTPEEAFADYKSRLDEAAKAAAPSTRAQ